VDAPLDRYVLDVPGVGGSVLLRPVPPKVGRRFQRDALLPSGQFDGYKHQRLRFQYAVVEPDFTAAEVVAIFEKYGPSVDLVLARVDQISRTPQVHVDAGVPHLQRQALRMVAVANQALRRRGDCRPGPRARASRGRPVRRRGSRRTTAATRAGPDDGSGDPEPGPSSGHAATRVVLLTASPFWGSAWLPEAGGPA
jgi:hypothetical protein